MKKNDYKQLAQKSVDELRAQVAGLRDQIRELSLGIKAEKNTRLKTMLKRDIARIMTLIQSKEQSL